ncbi:uncharacterized protein MONBRDRAFT_36068 [Monosiga brevicollis MX1]|uniref:Uncharacterized protein n=1 Tax=Monosiga brevicollis TaxID=81824 RepID=A9USW6_MONBE|nr:uncharacterized protein MONBRDRAFT_36068 [Monosiga brevicollis MX1]EDQ91138.1 predicted protein [Monosiga brevicollis MX1]|eukprot:XP_001743560.1 hypothetical protein [Monosiga brevicollis MX1]
MAFQNVKLCLLGDAGCGKSSLAQLYVYGSCPPRLEPTIGASFLTKMITLDNRELKLSIWDTAGQEKYRGLAPMYYRDAEAAVIVYDITKASTFQNVRSWVSELTAINPGQRLALAIAGNKADLDEQRQVAYQDASKYAESVGAIFFETSAIQGINVHELFDQLAVVWNEALACGSACWAQ